jgi:nitrogen regulatory protein PII-like uncharacterized protein
VDSLQMNLHIQIYITTKNMGKKTNLLSLYGKKIPQLPTN